MILGTIPFGFKYGKIHKGELVLEFQKGEIVFVSSSNQNLVEDIQKIFSKLPVIKKASETSISFNMAIKQLAASGISGKSSIRDFISA
jgi:hypothetical protein